MKKHIMQYLYHIQKMPTTTGEIGIHLLRVSPADVPCRQNPSVMLESMMPVLVKRHYLKNYNGCMINVIEAESSVRAELPVLVKLVSVQGSRRRSVPLSLYCSLKLSAVL